MDTNKDPEMMLRRAYVARIRALRIRRGLSQSKVASEMEIEYERYKKYENLSRLSVMPPYLIARFCRVVGADPAELLTEGRTGTYWHTFDPDLDQPPE